MKPEWSVSALLKAASISKPILSKISKYSFFQKIFSEINSSDQRRPEEDKSDTKSEREKMRSLNLSSDDFEIEKSKLPQ